MEKTFKLVQDTPMWVFNPDEEGCGLRATEVKPKLDRFLREKCGVTRSTNPTWFIGETSALDYKMRIKYVSKVEYETTEYYKKDGQIKGRNLYPLFFANLKSSNLKRTQKFKKLILFKNIQISIFTLHDSLLTHIGDNISNFFACHSFGTRQTKGFGCFRVFSEEKIDSRCSMTIESAINDINDINEKKIANINFSSYYFVVKSADKKRDKNLFSKTRDPKCRIPISEENVQMINLFSHINYFHKVIRSGINENKKYVKSMIYHFTNGDWDKPKIRRRFEYYNAVYKYITTGFLPEDENQRRRIENKYVDRSVDPQTNEETDLYREYKSDVPSSVVLYRDCLGLATEQAWQSYDGNNEMKEKISISSKSVERYTSPIKYHPVKFQDGYIVFIILEEINEVFRSASFSVINSIHDNALGNQNKNDVESLSASIPSANEFNLTDYFKYIDENRGKATETLGNSRVEKYVKQAFETLKKI